MAATQTQVMTEYDRAKAESFGAQMVDVVNKASLALMTSIGHQTGLFETMKDMPPADCARIAQAAGLNERYVREWLGSMVTGGIVEYNNSDRTYRLPPEHAASLTTEAGPQNVAMIAQVIAMLGGVEQGVVESFRNGGGVHYRCYPRFHRLMAELSAAQFDATLIDQTLPMAPGMVDRLRAGAKVADIGCGSGHAVNLMARTFPNSMFTGYDFSEEAIEAARAEAAKLGLKNAEFQVQDVAELKEHSTYDLITAFDAIHDQARPARVLEGIVSALKPGGAFLMVDIHASSHVGDNVSHPLSPYLYTVSCMHCMTVSLALDGEGLGAVWGEQTARRMLAEAGFRSVEMHRIEEDILNAYYVATR